MVRSPATSAVPSSAIVMSVDLNVIVGVTSALKNSSVRRWP
jgi:hypothetical protein